MKQMETFEIQQQARQQQQEIEQLAMQNQFNTGLNPYGIPVIDDPMQNDTNDQLNDNDDEKDDVLIGDITPNGPDNQNVQVKNLDIDLEESESSLDLLNDNDDEKEEVHVTAGGP